MSNMLKALFKINYLFMLLAITTSLGCSKSGDSGGDGGGNPTPTPVEVCADDNAANKNAPLPCICKPGFLPNAAETACSDGTGGGGGENPSTLVYSLNQYTTSLGILFNSGNPTVSGCSVYACTFTIAPALPSGLSLDFSTGRISGNANITSTRRNYEVTATNSRGQTKKSISLAVIPRAPKIASIPDLSLSLNSPVNNVYAVESGQGSVYEVSISPTLPPGLVMTIQRDLSSQINAVVISGTPTSSFSEADFEITAKTTPSFQSEIPDYKDSFKLSVKAPPSGFSYVINPLEGPCVLSSGKIECTFYRGETFTDIIANLSSGTDITYSITNGQNLPEGVWLSPSNGNIYTTFVGPFQSLSCPLEAGGFCEYNIRAANSIGFVETKLYMKVLTRPGADTMTYTVPTEIRNLTNPGDFYPVFTGSNPDAKADCHGKIDCYIISPALNIPGVTFSTQVGRISISPYIQYQQDQIPSAATNYTVTTQDGLVATFSLRILPAVPVFEYQTTEIVLEKNSSGSFNYQVDAQSIPEHYHLYRVLPTSFSVSPALPPGMSINTGPYTGVSTNMDSGGIIKGSPTELRERQKYTVTACAGVGACSSRDIYITAVPRSGIFTLGKSHGCMIDEETDSNLNKVLCWGDNTYGQLGYSSTDCAGGDCSVKARYVRLANNSPLTGVVDVVAGENHTCAIVGVNQEVLCWGDNSQDQIKSGGGLVLNPYAIVRKNAAVCASEQPVEECSNQAAGTSFKFAAQLSLGSGNTCFIAPGQVYDGSLAYVTPFVLHCLGKGFPTAAGQGVSVGVDASVLTNTHFVRKVAAGTNHVCFSSSKYDAGTQTVLLTEQLYCLGANDKNQRGNGTTAGSNAFSASISAVLKSSSPMTGSAFHLVSGGDHTCAKDLLDSNGKIFCWGDNTYGQLGINSYLASDIAQEMLGGIDEQTSSSFFLTKDSTFVRRTSSSDPVSSLLFSGKEIDTGSNFPSLSSLDFNFDAQFVQTKAGMAENFVCSYDTDPVLYIRKLSCWGKNDRGQLGSGLTDNQVTPGSVIYKGN